MTEQQYFPTRTARSVVNYVREDVESVIYKSRVISNEWEEKNNIFGLFEKDELKLGKLIGSGGFSDVYEISGFSSSSSWQSSSSSSQSWSHQQRLDRKIMKENAVDERGNLKYVVKHLKAKLMDNTKKFCMAAGDLVLEAQYLSTLNHENILKLRGWTATGIESYSNGKHDDYFLILDRLEDTLDKRMRSWKTREQAVDAFIDSPKSFDLEKSILNNDILDRVNVVSQVAEALRYLHSKNIVFRDLKPGNIGFDKFGVVKIFDFGLARDLPETSCGSDEFKMTGMVGTLRYMAPENALKQNYNQKVDTYSWALIFWSCLTLEKPYDKMTRNMYLSEVCRQGRRPALQDDWDFSICSLLEKSWAQDSCDRLSMVEVCQYLKEMEDELLQSEQPESSLEPHHHNHFYNQETKFLRCNTIAPFAA